MRLLQKFMLLAGVGQKVYGNLRIQRAAALVAQLATLAIFAAILMSALVIGLIYTICLFLASQGISTLTTLVVAILIISALTATVFLTINQYIQQLKTVTTTPMRETLDSFLDGFFSK